MRPEETTLNSVNWEFGMLLTPNHFLLQERYFEASLLWILRYATATAGLVGGGPRVPESQLGAAKYDPIVSIDEDDTSLSVAVSQCRALTAGGCIVEIGSERQIQRRRDRRLQPADEDRAPARLSPQPKRKSARLTLRGLRG